MQIFLRNFFKTNDKNWLIKQFLPVSMFSAGKLLHGQKNKEIDNVRQFKALEIANVNFENVKLKADKCSVI